MKITNIAGYKFVSLSDLAQLKQTFLQFCHQHSLFGTILLSHEGINLMLSGDEKNISQFKQFIAEMPAFADLDYRESISDYVPFNHMYVKLKKEIIPIGDDNINPLACTGKRLEPTEFKQWLDDNKEMLVLDTRNDFEVEAGTFDKAEHLNLKSFREFSKAIESLDPAYKDKPIVTFCTGGVRCEKATAVMLAQGFKEVYQLQGGILNYFAQCGGEHYHGDCFVFDQRECLDSSLKQSVTKDPSMP